LVRVATVCPKCHRERKPGEDSCARCGLLVTRWEGFVLQVPRLEPVEQAWQALLLSWNDDEAHRRFLEQASAYDGLDVAAALYRKARLDRPGDPRADEGLRRAAALAQNLYASRSQAERTRSPSGILRVVGLIGAVVVVLGAMWVMYLALRG
jgi:hypothetical protein